MLNSIIWVNNFILSYRQIHFNSFNRIQISCRRNDHCFDWLLCWFLLSLKEPVCMPNIFTLHQVLLELARNRNKIPLPKTIAGPGIPLPPEQDILISPNYQLAIPKKRPAQAVEETEEDEASADLNPSQEPKADVPQHNTPQRVSFPLNKRPK